MLLGRMDFRFAALQNTFMRCLLLFLGYAVLHAQPLDLKNVARLKVAWTYHTGALEPASGNNRKAAFEATTILVEGTLYLTTPYNHVIALDPSTGAEKWKFDPQVDRARDYSEVTNRGAAAWVDSKATQMPPAGCASSRALSMPASSPSMVRRASCA